jgi:DNA-binding NarL/FixJ family response regulator
MDVGCACSSRTAVRAARAEGESSEMRLNRSAVIFDRHPLWLDAISRVLEGVGVEVVGRATDSDEATKLVGEHSPDLLVAAVELSDDEQVACIRRAKEVRRELKAVVMADTTDLGAIGALFAAGASVYCVRTAQPEDIAFAVRQAFRRSVYIAGEMQEQPARPTPVQTDPAAHELTRRELEILRLVADGHSNGQLAKKLWVTEQTVKFHLSNVYRKLDVANRTEASRWAHLNGLLASAQEQTLDGVAA